MPPSYEIECPNYKTGCDIENCPRLLENIDVTLGKDGELVGSGFCTVKGGRFFGGISQEKIRVLAGKWQGAETVAKTCSRAPLFTPEYELEIKQTLKLDSIDDLAKFDREKISQLSLPDDKRTTALMAATKYRLRNAHEAEWSAAFTDYETAENAIFLYGIRREVDEGGTKFDRLHCILDCRKDYDGLRFRKLVLDLIDTFFDVFDAADFYSGLRQIDIYETPSRRMASEHGLIGWLDTARRDIDNFVRWFKCSKLDPRLLTLSLHALFRLLDKVCGTQFYPPSFEQQSLVQSLTWFAEGEGDEIETDYLKTTLQRISTALKDLQTALSIREHKVYDRHPEWEITVGTDDDGGPSYNSAKDRLNQSKELCAYYEKYGNPLGRFEEMADMLNADNHVLDALPELEKLIAMPVSYSYESETAWIENADRDSLVIDQINPWIVDAKKSMVEALRAFCDRRANALSPEGKAGEHWLHVSEKIRSAYQRQTIEAKAVEIIQKIEEADEQESVERRVNAKAKARRRKAKGDAEDWRTWQERKPRFRIKQIGDKISVADVEHISDEDEDYPQCLLYEGIPNTAATIIDILIKQASSDLDHPGSWWVKSSSNGKSFYSAFQKYNGKSTPAFEFKRDQIEVVRNEPSNPHNGEWRIRPNSTFKKNYKDFHRKDATLGS